MQLHKVVLPFADDFLDRSNCDLLVSQLRLLILNRAWMRIPLQREYTRDP